MVQKDGMMVKKSKIKEELGYLEAFGKDDIIAKCYDLAGALDKARDELATNNLILIRLLEELNELKSKIPRLDTNEYKKTWSWVNKIVFVLRKINRPLLSSEIIAWLLPHEPMLQYSRTPAQAFSAHIHKAVKYCRVLAYKLGGCRGYYYILPEWKDATGALMKEYEGKIFIK